MAPVRVESTDLSASAYAPFPVREERCRPLPPGRDASGIWSDYIAVRTPKQAPAMRFFNDIGLLGHVERILISAGQEASIMGHQRLCRSRAVGARPTGEIYPADVCATNEQASPSWK